MKFQDEVDSWEIRQYWDRVESERNVKNLYESNQFPETPSAKQQKMLTTRTSDLEMSAQVLKVNRTVAL